MQTETRAESQSNVWVSAELRRLFREETSGSFTRSVHRTAPVSAKSRQGPAEISSGSGQKAPYIKLRQDGSRPETFRGDLLVEASAKVDLVEKAEVRLGLYACYTGRVFIQAVLEGPNMGQIGASYRVGILSTHEDFGRFIESACPCPLPLAACDPTAAATTKTAFAELSKKIRLAPDSLPLQQ